MLFNEIISDLNTELLNEIISDLSTELLNAGKAPDVLHNWSPYTLPGSAIEFNTSPYLDNSLDSLIDYIYEPYNNSHNLDEELVFLTDSASNLSERVYEIFDLSPNSQPNWIRNLDESFILSPDSVNESPSLSFDPFFEGPVIIREEHRPDFTGLIREPILETITCPDPSVLYSPSSDRRNVTNLWDTSNLGRDFNRLSEPNFLNHSSELSQEMINTMDPNPLNLPNPFNQPNFFNQNNPLNSLDERRVLPNRRRSQAFRF